HVLPHSFPTRRSSDLHRWMCSGIGRCVVEGDHDECSEQSEGWSQGKRPNVRPIESEGSDRHSPSHTCRNKQVLTDATKVIGPEIDRKSTRLNSSHLVI